MDMSVINSYIPLYRDALLLTLRIGWQGVFWAFVIGLGCTLIRQLHTPVLRGVVTVYVELLRNTPLLVQLFFLYFALPKIGIRISAEVCGSLGLGLLGGAYMAETFRSGLDNIAPVQEESALSLGMSETAAFRYVILPQTVRRLILLSINLITRMVKTTSLVMMIGIVEVLKVGQQIIEANRKTSPNAAFGVFAVVFLMYFLICWPVSRLAARLEKRWA